ncbi:hypothetical protein KSB_16400 [Ktedonobacter robiniae]|uniref:Bacterial bifunctional deaminase-reductase C-terminal domain-containing protein n=1 Tax=Ktedonobacter robiniae TaxID=2778365 RepID=A0ABQ3UKI2_9CHLR|nr:hypothetical protein KSB_16400 [Ktedonobacter robiniae]
MQSKHSPITGLNLGRPKGGYRKNAADYLEDWYQVAFLRKETEWRFRSQLGTNPIILGGGLPLFQDIAAWTRLKLAETKAFQNGVVGLHYQTIRQ